MDWTQFVAEPGWEAIGLLGQLTFGSRFIYQWIASERAKRSVLPVGFWWLSILGSILIMTYAIHKASLTFIMPTLMGMPIYLRNLWMIRRAGSPEA